MSDIVGGKAVENGLPRFGGEKARDHARKSGMAVDPASGEGSARPEEDGDEPSAGGARRSGTRHESSGGKQDTPEFDRAAAADPDRIRHDGP